MNKKILVIAFMSLFIGCVFCIAAPNYQFATAVKTCEKFSMDGEIEHDREIFDVSISLEKAKDNGCIYKERISQGKNYQLLTCRFEKGQLPFISSSMTNYVNQYKNQISKNEIFSAKLSTNYEVFNKYLANPKICKITASDK